MRIIIEVRDVTMRMLVGCREAGAEQKFKDISNAYEVWGFLGRGGDDPVYGTYDIPQDTFNRIFKIMYIFRFFRADGVLLLSSILSSQHILISISITSYCR